MSEFTTAALLNALLSQLPSMASTRLCVALSGGLDSSVLLHALAHLRQTTTWNVRAIHVDHQLQALSSQWSQQCSVWAQALGIECDVLKVAVTDIEHHGIEAAAREARYAALRARLQSNEVLLTAHHADDQWETVLLALLRGAGVDGLAAMPPCTPFGAGWHLRPLLGFTRAELHRWALSHHVPFVDDPTNLEPRFDRNFLRQRILPELRARWPAAAQTASRSTAHLRETQTLLREFIAQDYAQAAQGEHLSVAVLRNLSAPRRRALLRYWLQRHDVLMPSTRTLHSLEQDVLHAADDRVPCTHWDDVTVYRYRDCLYLERAQLAMPPLELTWRRHEAVSLPNALGTLHMQPCDRPDTMTMSRRLAAARLPATLTIRFRVGGERIRLPRDTHRRSLKKLLQTSAVLPWWRDSLPLIYADDELVAVADLWISDGFAARPDETAVEVVWQERPGIFS